MRAGTGHALPVETGFLDTKPWSEVPQIPAELAALQKVFSCILILRFQLKV
jgi:hypothetical protein